MKLELSTWSIIKTILILIGLFVLWQIRDIFGLLFIVIILVAALSPAVDWLVSRDVSRVWSATILVGGIVAILSLLVALVVPTLVTQLQQFLTIQLPGLVTQLTPVYQSFNHGQQLSSDVVTQLQGLTGKIFTGILSIFGSLLSIFTVLILMWKNINK